MSGIQEAPMSGDVLAVNPIISIEKRCTKCGIIKPLSKFHKRSKRRGGHKAECKACGREYDRKFRAIHLERTKEDNRRCGKEWRANNKEKARESGRKWREANKEKVKEYLRKWKASNKDEKWKLNNSMSGGIRKSLKRGKAGKHWESLVGYTVDALKRHLEKQFVSGMAWDNYGEWHIDHIIPLAAFNYETPEDIDFKKAWGLKNLQPLWASENMRKRDKLNSHFQPSFAFGSKE